MAAHSQDFPVMSTNHPPKRLPPYTTPDKVKGATGLTSATNLVTNTNLPAFTNVVSTNLWATNGLSTNNAWSTNRVFTNNWPVNKITVPPPSVRGMTNDGMLLHGAGTNGP